MALITLTAGNDQAPPPAIAAGDTVNGLAGNDTITAPASTFVFGSDGNDVLTVSNQSVANGNKGDDTVIGAGTAVTLYGGQGKDVLRSVSTSILFGNDGNDSLFSVFADTLYGNIGTDTLIVAPNSIAYGGQDNDLLQAASSGATGATLAGDAGNDTIVSAGSGGALLYGDNPTSTVTGNDAIWAYGTDTAIGGGGDDSLVSFGAKTIFGNQGNDTLTFATGVSSSTGVTLYGGKDNDLLIGNVNTVVTDANINTVNQNNNNGGGGALLLGDKGTDTLIGSYDSTRSDTLIGGDGGDSIRGTDFSAPSTNNGDLIIGGSDSVPGADTTTGIDTIDAKGGNDTIIAGGGGSRISAGDGKDSIIGAAGADSVVGGNGEDIIYGDKGNDTLYGGDNNDTIYAGAGADTIVGGKGDDYIELETDGQADQIWFVPTKDAINFFGLPDNANQVFSNIVNQPNNPAGDSIIGFEPGTDKLVLDGSATTYTSEIFGTNGLFASLSTNTPVSLSIVTGTDTNLVGAAQGLLVYYSPTGELFYNPDQTTAGFGAGGRFAILDTGLALSPTDFIIV